MQYQTSTQAVSTISAGCIVVTLDGTGKLSDSAHALNRAAQGYLQDRVDANDIRGTLAETLLLPSVPGIIAQRVLLVGTGKDALNTRSATKILDAIAKATQQLSGHIAIAIEELANDLLSASWWAEHSAVALVKAQYRYTATKAAALDGNTTPDTITWLGSDQLTALHKGAAIGQGINYCKTLGDLPPNICTPTYLAEQALALTSTNALQVTVLDESELAEMGAGAFVSVAKGSSEPGKMIIMNYQGGQPDEPAHLILGKGITFDTGGISLKPGLKMDEMKYDMCGAASVLGTMQAILTLQPKINIIGMITSAENMPAGNASKPGDVVTSLSGKTIEILNTDAEGRLVLCDAMTYAIQHLKPASMVDIATLTGACMAALGDVNSGLFTQDEALAGEILSAAQYSHDKVWRLPLEDDYQDLLDSNFADIANIGGPLAGATTAACFLSRFSEETPWAHLDIAGTAWGGAGKSKGSSGRPVALLVNYLLAKQ